MTARGLVRISFPPIKLNKPQKSLAEASRSKLYSLCRPESGIRPARTLSRCKPGPITHPPDAENQHDEILLALLAAQACVVHLVQMGFCAFLQRTEAFLRCWVLNFLPQRVYRSGLYAGETPSSRVHREHKPLDQSLTL